MSWDHSPWAYPGKQNDANERDADTWPRHKTRARRRRKTDRNINRMKEQNQ